MDDENKMAERNTDLLWIRIGAGICGLIACLALVILIAADSHAEDPAPGFQPGKRAFSNPFANNPGADPFGEEGEDEEDPPPPAQWQGGGDTGGQPSGNMGSGIEVGGSPAGGVISKNEMGFLEVNTESGFGKGSREVITDFNFPDADVMDIAKTLGRLTGKNFILDKDVKGKITIVANSPISVGDAWKAFLTALDINGFTLIPSGKFIRIARQRDARDKQLRTYVNEDSPDSDALITRVFPLKYISAEEVARTFRSFMPANSRIIPYEQTNTVIVTDTGSNIAKLAKMLEFLDVEGFDAGIEVVPVKFASAVELSNLIDTLLPGTGTGKVPSPGGRPFRGGGQFTARRTKEGGMINTIIADERTNTLIIHANAKGADQVRALVAKLDKKIPAQVGGGKIHVVYLQFADSEEIAKTLNNLTTQTSAPKAPTSIPGAGGVGVNPAENTLFEGQIKVSADKATNSIVITASPSDFVTVQRVINKLDIPRDEVYIEVVILEMSLGRTFDFSANIALPTQGLGLLPQGKDLLEFITNPISQKGVLLGFKTGKERTIPIGGQNVTVSSVMGLIKAIQTNSKANVLATPQILTLDNVEATFETSEKVPVESSSVSQGTVTSGITKESISLSVTIKPQINKISNFVKMDIKTKLADISDKLPPASLQGKAFVTFERNAQTSVVVADADTVVMGGLVRDKHTEIVSKVPILGDIPLLGWLFRAKATTVDKTNLLMFITPQIIRQYEKVRAILDKKLKERDDFLEANAGGEDPMRASRDEMIRSLPDIKAITNYKADKASTIGAEPSEFEDAPAAEPVPAPAVPKAAPAPEAMPPVPAPDAVSPVPATPNGTEIPPMPTAPVPDAPPSLDTLPPLGEGAPQ